MALPANADLPQNGSIVSRWLLDDASGQTRVDSVGSNDLEDNNTVTTGTGPFGDTCADFESGNTEYLSISDASQTGLGLSTDYTISMWINVETNPGLYVLIGKGTVDVYRIFYRSTTKIQADYFDASVNETQLQEIVDLGTATWVHVSFAFDISVPSATMYVNGDVQGSTMSNTAATSIVSNNSEFNLGGYDGGSFPFDGMMQDAIVWSTKLTDSEASDLYDAYYAPAEAVFMSPNTSYWGPL